MLFEIRVDKSRLLVIDTQYAAINGSSPDAGSELITATVLDTKLSDAEKSEIFAYLADLVDYFSVSPAATEPPGGDWYDDWLEKTRATN